MIYSVTIRVEVEADTPDEAIEKATLDQKEYYEVVSVDLRC